MISLTFIVSVLAVAVFLAKRALQKELAQVKEIRGDDYTLCELILDKAEDVLLSSGGAIYYSEQL